MHVDNTLLVVETGVAYIMHSYVRAKVILSLL